MYAAGKDGCVTEKGDFMHVHTHELEEVCMHADSYLCKRWRDDSHVVIFMCLEDNELLQFGNGSI